MALVGVVNPSHKEEARHTMGRLPGWVTTERALELALDNPKWSPWSWELLNALFSEYQERADNISTSSLVSHCPRGEVIKRRMDYVLDLQEMYIPFRGTMVHRTLEKHAHPDAIAEARFYTEVDGITVSCSPDHLTRKVLTDYKVTENPPQYQYPWANHTEQVEFNAYIVRNALSFDFPDDPWGTKRTEWELLPFDPRMETAEHLALVYLGPKMPKVLEVMRTENVFRGGKVKKARVPDVWDNKRVLALMRPRLEMFNLALQTFPDWPAGAEQLWGGSKGWECPGAPLCKLPNCIAKRYPDRLMWEVPDDMEESNDE